PAARGPGGGGSCAAERPEREGEGGGGGVPASPRCRGPADRRPPNPPTWVNTEGEGVWERPAHRHVAAATWGRASRGRSALSGPGGRDRGGGRGPPAARKARKRRGRKPGRGRGGAEGRAHRPDTPCSVTLGERRRAGWAPKGHYARAHALR